MALQRKRPEASAVQLKHVTELVEVETGIVAFFGNGTTWWLVLLLFFFFFFFFFLLAVVVVTAKDVTYLLFMD